MGPRSRVAFGVLRGLYAVFWILITVGPLVSPNAIPPQSVPAAKAFWSALEASGFMIPLVGACFGLGGLCTLFKRTAPLGLLILSPPLVVIVLFNILLAHSVSAWVVLAPVHLALLWEYRARLAPLWSGAVAGPGVE